MGRQVDKRVAKVTLHTEPGPGEGVGSLRGSKGLGLGGAGVVGPVRSWHPLRGHRRHHLLCGEWPGVFLQVPAGCGVGGSREYWEL